MPKPQHLQMSEVLNYLKDSGFQTWLWHLMDKKHIQNERTMQWYIATNLMKKIASLNDDGTPVYHEDYRVAIEEYDRGETEYPDYSIKGLPEQGTNDTIYLKAEFKFFGEIDEPGDDEKGKIIDDIQKIIDGINAAEENEKIVSAGVVMFPVHSRAGWDAFITEIEDENAEHEMLHIIPIYRETAEA